MKSWTASFFVSLVVLVIIWDVLALFIPALGGTFSHLILDVAWAHPFVSVLMGVLVGHLAWPRASSARYLVVSRVVLGVFGALVLVLDLLGWLPQVLPLWYVLPAIPLGHFLWGQARP